MACPSPSGSSDFSMSSLTTTDDDGEGSQSDDAEEFASDWGEFLQIPENIENMRFIAPASFFKHAPLVDIWNELVGDQNELIFELSDAYETETESPPTLINWFAKIFMFVGYRCLAEYLTVGLENETRHLIWADYFTEVVKPLGHSIDNKIVLKPPFIENEDIEKALTLGVEKVRGKPTLKPNHIELISNNITKRHIYAVNSHVEAIPITDNAKFSETQIAKVVRWNADRMLLKFVALDNELWYSPLSEYVHPLGWSNSIGHKIVVPRNFQLPKREPLIFPDYPKDVPIKVGQYLEVRHPRYPHKIVAATVSKMLKHGYFYVRTSIEAYYHAESAIEYAVHITSPYIFPCGFCERHGIELVPPENEDIDTFKWDDYLADQESQVAQIHLLPQFQRPKPEFKVGMKMEAVDELNPETMSAATIIDIKDHLLWVHFDGWKTPKSEVILAEHWIDFESPLIYPMGYAELLDVEWYRKIEYPKEASRVTKPSPSNDQAKGGRSPVSISVDGQNDQSCSRSSTSEACGDFSSPIASNSDNKAELNPGPSNPPNPLENEEMENFWEDFDVSFYLNSEIKSGDLDLIDFDFDLDNLEEEEGRAASPPPEVISFD